MTTADVVFLLVEYAMKLLKALVLIYIGSIPLWALGAVYQEHKLWTNKSNNSNSSSDLPAMSIPAHIRVFWFNVLWMVGMCLGFILLLPKIIWYKFDLRYVERDFHCLVERINALYCISMFVGPVIVRGREHLPPDVPKHIYNHNNNNNNLQQTTNNNNDTTTINGTTTTTKTPIYVANHASQIDIGVVYYLFRSWKWIAKKEILFLPGVGLGMYLSRHVFIDRRSGKNKSSIQNLYEKSNQAIRRGIPMFIFPQGTRKMSHRLPFKDGAFNLALENQSPLVPISIEIPKTVWNNWYPICLLWGQKVDPVILTVHPMIMVNRDTITKEQLKARVSDVIYSVLPPIPLAPSSSSSKKDKNKDYHDKNDKQQQQQKQQQRATTSTTSLEQKNENPKKDL